MIEETILDAIEHMEKAVEHVQSQFTTVRTGRASPALVEKLMAEYYGSMNNLDEVAPEDEARAYRNKSYPRRMLVITAGSLMHLIIAISLVFTVYSINGRRVETDRVGIGSVSTNYPAGQAGVKPGDIVVSIDGVQPKSADDFVTAIRSHQPGDAVTLVLDRDGQTITKVVGLGSNPNPGPGAGSAFLGVASGNEVVWNNESVVDAARDSVFDLGPTLWQSIRGVATVLNPVNIVGHLTGANNDVNTRPTTVVGISKLSAEIGDESGFGGLLLTLAAVNVFVGLLNMAPGNGLTRAFGEVLRE